MPGRRVDDLPGAQIDTRIGIGDFDIQRTVAAGGLTVDLIAGCESGVVTCQAAADEWRGRIAVAAFITRGVTVRIRLGVVEDRVVLEFGRQVGNYAETAISVVDVVIVIRADPRMVLHVTVALVAIDCDTNLESVGKRNVDRSLHTLLVIVSVGAFHIAFEEVAGLGRNEEDRAAGRIPAEQGALRTFENLHVLQVGERTGAHAVAAGGAALRAHADHVGEVHTHRRGRCGILVEAANREGCLFRAVTRVDGQRGSISGKIRCHGDVAILQLIFVVHRHRDRDVLQAFLDAPGRNDDFAGCHHRFLRNRRHRHRGA